MGLIRFKHKGSFNNTEQFFNRVLRRDWANILARYGAEGVELLKAATPEESGETRDSWNFEIEKRNGQITLAWTNHHENDGANIAILIIYGHGLHNGGYVEGNDFVHPTIAPLMQELADRAWKEVTK